MKRKEVVVRIEIAEEWAQVVRVSEELNISGVFWQRPVKHHEIDGNGFSLAPDLDLYKLFIDWFGTGFR